MRPSVACAAVMIAGLHPFTRGDVAALHPFTQFTIGLILCLSVRETFGLHELADPKIAGCIPHAR